MAYVLITETIPGWGAGWISGDIVSASDDAAAALVEAGIGSLVAVGAAGPVTTFLDNLQTIMATLGTTLPDDPGVLWLNGGVLTLS